MWVFVLAILVGYAVSLGGVVVMTVIGALMSAADVSWGAPLLMILFSVPSVQLQLHCAASVVGLIHMDLRIRRDQFDLG